MQVLIIPILLFILCEISNYPTVSTNIERATSLLLNQELRREAIQAPGKKLYAFVADPYNIASAMELRISHMSQPPAEFSFQVLPFPDDGSIIIEKRRKLIAKDIRKLLLIQKRQKRLLQQQQQQYQLEKTTTTTILPTTKRRQLNTAIHRLKTGIKFGGVLLPDGTESKRILIIVSAKPVGILPTGPETSVIVPFNIIIEKKLMDDLIPESAARMVSFGVVCLLCAVFCLVPYLSYVLRTGDDLARLILFNEPDADNNDESRRRR
jgi:hypothetical protein